MCCVMLYHSFLFWAVARPDTDTEAPCKWKNRSRSLCATRKQKTFNTVAYLFSGETHSLIAFHTVHRLSIYYARTIIYCNQATVLLDNSTFISFSSVAVISLTLAKYFLLFTQCTTINSHAINYTHWDSRLLSLLGWYSDRRQPRNWRFKACQWNHPKILKSSLRLYLRHKHSKRRRITTG